jgi:hypothetical protein
LRLFARSTMSRSSRPDGPFPVCHLVDSVRIVLKSHHMQPEPVEIRAFVNEPDVKARTQTLGNPAFGGATAFFGHGSPDPHGQSPASAVAGAHDAMPRPPPQPGVKERFDLELNITQTLKAQKDDATYVSLKLVAVDAAGNEVPAEKLILEETVIEFE